MVKNGQPESWAWRDDTIKQVDTDVVNVAQTVFSIDDFNIDDVGRCFARRPASQGRKAASNCRSSTRRPGDVFMSVSTNP